MFSNLYKKTMTAITLVIEHIATLLFIAFFIVVLLQVFFRFVLDAPLTWSEESARYFNLWSVLLGAAVAVKYRDHLRVDLIDGLVKKWPYRAQVGFYFFTTVFSAIVSVSFLTGSIKMTIDRWEIPLTMVPISQGVLYLALFVGSLLMLWYFANQLISYVSDLVKGKGGDVK